MSGVVSDLLPVLYYSVIGLPVLGPLLILPSALIFASLAWGFARLMPWYFALPVALLPFMGWSLVYAPINQSRILEVASDDGGALPDVYDTDVLAVLDFNGTNHPSKVHCIATCIEILRNGELKGIFLARYISRDGTDVHGVIYRRTHYGNRCDRELTPRGVAPLCARMIPATLWNVIHVLTVEELPKGDPNSIGLHGGEQIRLLHRYFGEVQFQSTSLHARVPWRMPLFGDFQLPSGDYAPRMATKTIDRLWERPPLMTLLYDRLERRARGLE